MGLAKMAYHFRSSTSCRVTVNRYWQMILVGVLFRHRKILGFREKPPTHPELLDWLARDFISSGWNVHHLLKKNGPFPYLQAKQPHL